MTRITIPDTSDNLKKRLVARAVEHGRSIEADRRRNPSDH
jgi:plasmid stability protein